MIRLNLWPARRMKSYSFVLPVLLIIFMYALMNVSVVEVGRELGNEYKGIEEVLEFTESRVNSFVRRHASLKDKEDLENALEKVTVEIREVNAAAESQAFFFSAFANLVESLLPQNLRVESLEFQNLEKLGQACMLTGRAKRLEDLTRFIDILARSGRFGEPFLYFHKEVETRKYEETIPGERLFKIGFPLERAKK